MKNQVFIGRNLQGEKFYLETEVILQEGAHQTIEHTTLGALTRLSMSGVLISKYGSITRDGNWVSIGQNVGELARVRNFTGSEYRGKISEIVKIWERWHLNDTNSHCIHQDQAIKWDECPPCSETGYKAGSSWLVEELPSEVLTRIYELGLITTANYARVVMERVAYAHPLSA